VTAPTLTDFLLARIAEDETRVSEGFMNAMGVRSSKTLRTWTSASRAAGLWDQGRLLRECEAKRRIVERHSETVECGNVGCQRRGLSGLHCLACDDESPCPDLRDLAAVYVDHPDYRDEWRT
jgi:hypothetical protein